MTTEQKAAKAARRSLLVSLGEYPYCDTLRQGGRDGCSKTYRRALSENTRWRREIALRGGEAIRRASVTAGTTRDKSRSGDRYGAGSWSPTRTARGVVPVLRNDAANAAG